MIKIWKQKTKMTSKINTLIQDQCNDDDDNDNDNDATVTPVNITSAIDIPHELEYAQRLLNALTIRIHDVFYDGCFMIHATTKSVHRLLFEEDPGSNLSGSLEEINAWWCRHQEICNLVHRYFFPHIRLSTFIRYAFANSDRTCTCNDERCSRRHRFHHISALSDRKAQGCLILYPL